MSFDAPRTCELCFCRNPVRFSGVQNNQNVHQGGFLFEYTLYI